MDLRRYNSSSLADASSGESNRPQNSSRKLPRLFRNLKAKLESLGTSKSSVINLRSPVLPPGGSSGQESPGLAKPGLHGDESPLPSLRPRDGRIEGTEGASLLSVGALSTRKSPHSSKPATAFASSAGSPNPVILSSSSAANAVPMRALFARGSTGTVGSSFGWDSYSCQTMSGPAQGPEVPMASPEGVGKSSTPGVQDLEACDGDIPPLNDAGGPTSRLLVVSPTLPASMSRESWTLEDYTISKRIHKAPACAVYRATCRMSGLQVALKVHFLSQVPINAAHMLKREIDIHGQLVHKHITRLYGVFLDDAHRLVLVQEYAPRGDLYNIVSRLGGRLSAEQVAFVVMRPLLEALSHLHSKGICHRDIKPENLLFSEGWRLLVADFGVSIDLNQERAVTRAGTEGYMAPEVERCPLKVEPDENKDDPRYAYSTAVDIWAVGVLAYELMVGFPPVVMPAAPAAPAVSGFVRSEMTAAALHFPASVPPVARSFVAAALAADPGERPTAAQLLQHPWLLQPSATAKSASALAPRTAVPAEAEGLWLEKGKMAYGTAVMQAT